MAIEIRNNTESPFTFPIPGKGTRRVMKQRVVDGCLLEEEAKETYTKAAKVLVLPPSLTGPMDLQKIEVSKAQLKGLRESKVFQHLEAERHIEVIGE